LETTTPFSTGATIATDQANVDLAKTSHVGSFSPNAFGLHDMLSNVWEWVYDCYNDSYIGAPTDGSAWTAGNCGRRVLRGGSWGGVLRDFRSANRFWDATVVRSYDLGFRVGRTF